VTQQLIQQSSGNQVRGWGSAIGIEIVVLVADVLTDIPARSGPIAGLDPREPAFDTNTPETNSGFTGGSPFSSQNQLRATA